MVKEKSVLFTTKILNQCPSVNGKKHVYRKNFRKRGFAFEFKQTYLYLSQEIKMVCSQDGWLIPFIAWHISIFSKYHDYFVNSIGDSKWWSFKAWNNVQLAPNKTVFLPRQMSMMSYLNNSLLPSSPPPPPYQKKWYIYHSCIIHVVSNSMQEKWYGHIYNLNLAWN